MPLYNCEMGDPLDMLVEECCEVIQAVMKFRRFHGANTDENPITGLSSREQVIQEIGDVLAIIDILVTEKGALGIDMAKLEAAKAAKFARLEQLFGFIR